MLYKKYLYVFVTTILMVLLMIALTNVVIDPANIYHNNSNTIKEFAKKIKESPYGVEMPKNSWGEREIKQALAQQPNDASCVVIGSSHVMMISSSNQQPSLSKYCPRILNLGVSGAGIEDFITLSYELLNANQHPKYIVFGIDPWSLDFNRDVRYLIYQYRYFDALNFLNSDLSNHYFNKISKSIRLAKNAINLEYFIASVSMVAASLKNSAQATKSGLDSLVVVKDRFIHKDGYLTPVILPDGSYIYSHDYVLQNTPPKVALGGENYKIIEGRQWNESAIALFIQLQHALQNRGTKIILLMTPYHPNVWALPQSPTVIALSEMEQLVNDIGTKNKMMVLGSYHPERIGCTANEFYDFMHAMPECLQKIQ